MDGSRGRHRSAAHDQNIGRQRSKYLDGCIILRCVELQDINVCHALGERVQARAIPRHRENMGTVGSEPANKNRPDATAGSHYDDVFSGQI